MQVFAENAELYCVIIVIIYRVFENRVVSKICGPRKGSNRRRGKTE
jgi:hypothetical protein